MVSSIKVMIGMKNNHWFSFLSGALIGAGITWLLTSKEGKEVVGKITSKGNELKDKLADELAQLNEQINEWSEKQKTS
jgi:2-keto-3-deoxy-galactonokinase